MDMVIALLVFVGLALGSFVNALIWRIHEQDKYRDENGLLKKLTAKDKARLHDLSITKGRSMCSHCGHPLSALDLIPVFSWLALRGKCRYCQYPIPDTPVAELLTALVLIVSYIYWPYASDSWQVLDVALFAVWSLIVTCLVALVLYDAKWFLLPDRIVWPLTVLSISFVAIRMIASGSVQPGINAVMGAVVIAGTFWVLWRVSKGSWIGYGDVKLGISLGLLAGGLLMAWLVIFIASVLGTLVTLPRVVRGEGLKSSLPFGPHLIAGAVIVVLFGGGILGWYLGLMSY